ncbi:MAG TPA: hypothetical protein VFC78_20645 [Tepidisphaeraceae bacterium]|nr:hypothetical protein [Tepidisphaeraceae bacterium]
MRRSIVRVVSGALLIVGGIAISVNPIMRWWSSIYWYQYRQTASVFRDLKEGNGKPAPENNPLEAESWYTHGWMIEQVDLARVAFDELQRRDLAGKLTAGQRREITELELANEDGAIVAPAQYYLNKDLYDRAAAGTLNVDEQRTFFDRIAAFSVASRPVVAAGHAVPIRIRYHTAMFPSPWEIVTTIKSVRIDGQPAGFSPTFGNQWLAGGWTLDDDRRVNSAPIGLHHLEIELSFDVHPGGRDHSIIHSKTRTLETQFKVVTLKDATIRLIDKPELAKPICDAISVQTLKYHVWEPGDVFGELQVGHTPLDIAFKVYARFDGHDWLIGHIAHAASAPTESLRIDSDYKNQPLPEPPGTVDIVFRSDAAVASDALFITEIWKGDLIKHNVAIETRGGR